MGLYEHIELGISRHKTTGRYKVQIPLKGKCFYVGTFIELDNAREARRMFLERFPKDERDHDKKMFEKVAKRLK